VTRDAQPTRGAPRRAGIAQQPPVGLAGLRILDLGRYIAAPLCAAMLTDQGVEVFRRWTKLVGRPELVDDPHPASNLARGEHDELLSTVMAKWCVVRSSQDGLAEFGAATIPGRRALTPAQALDADGNINGGFFTYERVAVGWGNVPIASRVVRTAAAAHRPAPELGAHSAELLLSLGYGDDDVGRLTPRSRTRPRLKKKRHRSTALKWTRK
jgi:crotonobetainyl-CoA:carnitine CoA-transferase CaiB-like acyl-CoA transferase